MPKSLKKIFKWLLISFVSFIAIVVVGLFIFVNVLSINAPTVDTTNISNQRMKLGDNFYKISNNWIRKNEFGLWEMYAEGDPFERGLAIGKLSKELVQNQEEVFITEIKKWIPSETYLSILKYFVIFFNRNLESYIPKEYLEEIYGVSLSGNPKYNFIGTPYERILNYHGAHDIGHSLQNMHLVGCTSFGLWGSRTSDSSLLLGRNFDFYFGDDFAKDKIVCFINPSKGHKFMMVTWGGMMGAVSGMNDMGLTVTINSDKSDLTMSGKTPVSLVARTILQYAKNIKEAFEIVKNAKMFVSESFLIGSAANKKAVVIEKTDKITAIYSGTTDEIICTNHFQSDELIAERLNVENILEETSTYRYARTKELLNTVKSADYLAMASVLRNPYGMNNSDIGLGNEKAVNQLIAHHAVIFKPEQRLVWVSTVSYQLGAFVCYDLDKVFNEYPGLSINDEIDERAMLIPADTLLYSKKFQDYNLYKTQKTLIENCIKSDSKSISDETIKNFIAKNPEFYLTYKIAGDYYKEVGNLESAKKYYNMSLTKELPSISEKKSIIKLLSK